RAEGFVKVQAGIGRVWILRGHTPKIVFYNRWRAAADPELEKEDVLPLMPAHKVVIPARGGVPAFVLDKAVVGAQGHRHRPAADRAAGDKRGRDRPAGRAPFRQAGRAAAR